MCKIPRKGQRSEITAPGRNPPGRNPPGGAALTASAAGLGPGQAGLGRGRHSGPAGAANRWPHRLIAVVSRLTQVASSTSLPSVPYSMSNPPGVAT
jgi:hypothetical protein